MDFEINRAGQPSFDPISIPIGWRYARTDCDWLKSYTFVQSALDGRVT